MTRMTRKHGSQVAKKLRQRLEELAAVDTLADISLLPGANAHELTGERRGQISLKLHGGSRLIVIPASNPPPAKADGGLAWAEVEAVVVTEIVDYH